MNLIYYLPGILGLCVFLSLCAILAAAEKTDRKKLLYIQLFPMLLLLFRFFPYLNALEWRLVFRRPLDYACAVLPWISVLLGIKLCGSWKRLDKPQAPVSAIALVSCFFLTCILLINQIPLKFYRDSCGYADMQGKQVFVVLENTDPGSFSGLKFYLYENEVFHGLAEIEMAHFTINRG